jgi:hypothetical protein
MGRERERAVDRSEKPVSLDTRLLEKLDDAFGCALQRSLDALRATAPEADIGIRFDAALSAVLEAAAAQPDLTRLCLVEAPGLGAGALARKDTGLQRFVDLLDSELAATRGGEAPPLVSEMVVGGIYEVLQRVALKGEIASAPELAAPLGELWLPALRDR